MLSFVVSLTASACALELETNSCNFGFKILLNTSVTVLLRIDRPVLISYNTEAASGSHASTFLSQYCGGGGGDKGDLYHAFSSPGGEE
jgi:hypothetical protein